jgi:hypothetical protein
MSSFADINIIWSTSRPTVEGINARVIQRNSVKPEFFRNFDEYYYVIYSDRNAHDRASYARMTEAFVDDLLNDI